MRAPLPSLCLLTLLQTQHHRATKKRPFLKEQHVAAGDEPDLPRTTRGLGNVLLGSLQDTDLYFASRPTSHGLLCIPTGGGDLVNHYFLNSLTPWMLENSNDGNHLLSPQPRALCRIHLPQTSPHLASGASLQLRRGGYVGGAANLGETSSHAAITGN